MKIGQLEVTRMPRKNELAVMVNGKLHVSLVASLNPWGIGSKEGHVFYSLVGVQLVSGVLGAKGVVFVAYPFLLDFIWWAKRKEYKNEQVTH